MSTTIEHYLAFPQDLFSRSIYVKQAAAGQDKQDAFHEEYTKLLEQYGTTLEEVLSGNQGTHALPYDFYQRLVVLCEQDFTHPDRLRQLKDSGYNGRPFDLSFEEILRKQGIEEIAEYNKGIFAGKVRAHLGRMLKPIEYCSLYREYVSTSETDELTNEHIPIVLDLNDRLPGIEVTISNGICHKFASAFIDYVLSMEPEDNELLNQNILHRVRGSIGGDDESVRAFWTLAPYIYDTIVNSGIDDKEAMQMVWDWGVMDSDSHGRYRLDLTNIKVSIIGARNIQDQHFLSIDDRGPRHLLMNLASKNTAYLLLDQYS